MPRIPSDTEQPIAGGLWTASEIEASVDTWVEMLQHEKSCVPYKKSEMVRQLQRGPLSVRNKASVEMRLQNISAVAIALNHDWVKGYKPLSSVGPTQWARIEQRLHTHGIGNSIDAEVQAELQRLQNAQAGESQPHDDERLRERAWQLVTQRRGQNTFRTLLLDTYRARCAISRSDAASGLEAAHIEPYNGPASNVAPNGLLLRADIHRLFDRGLLCIEPDGLTTLIAPGLKDSTYALHEGQRLLLPDREVFQPARKHLAHHLEWAMRRW